MKLTSKQINEIAQNPEAGMKVFINQENLEIREIPDLDDMGVDTGLWDEELKEIENEWTGYVVIEKLKTGESFQIMEDFTDALDDLTMKEELSKILSRKSPFANFKAEIESSVYREEWYSFRTRKFEDYVKERLEKENIEYE